MKNIKSYKKNGTYRVCSPNATYNKLIEKLYNNKISIIEDFFLNTGPKKSVMSLCPICEVRGNDDFCDLVGVRKVSGKGVTVEQAYCSGLMEAVERYSISSHIKFNYDMISTPKNMLNNNFDILSIKNSLKNPEIINLYVTDEEICDNEYKWYKFFDICNNSYYLPLYYIASLYEGTNGMASGNTLEEAIIHGACEVIERHCQSIIEDNNQITPEIDQTTIDSDVILNLLDKLESCGHKIILKYCSLSFNIPVVCAISTYNSITYKKVNCLSYGCSTTTEEAIIRALTEVIQLGESPKHHYEYSKIYHHFNNSYKIRYQDIKGISDDNLINELKNINNDLLKHNMKLYYCDCTNIDLDIPSVFVYISNSKIYYDIIVKDKTVQEERFSLFSKRIKNLIPYY